MNTTILLANINQYVTLDEAETSYLESIVITRSFKKNEVIVQNGEPARYLILVNAGFVMSYYTDKDNFDHVVQFASNGWWTGDLYSLAENTPTIYTTKGLTDGEVLLLPKLAHNQLLEKYVKFEKYFRIIFHNALMRLQFRFIENYSTTTEERYLAFRTRFPNMEQHVPQKYIASYLGITPEFLSKVRRKLMKS